MRDSLSIVRSLAPVDEVLVTGGGAKSPFVRKMQADVYGLPVVRVNRESLTARTKQGYFAPTSH